MATTQSIHSIESGASAIIRISSKLVKQVIKLCEKLESLEAVSDGEWCSAFTAELEQMGWLLSSLASTIIRTFDGDHSLFRDAKSQLATSAQLEIFYALVLLYANGRVAGVLPISESRSRVAKILLARDVPIGLREHCSWFLNLA